MAAKKNIINIYDQFSNAIYKPTYFPLFESTLSLTAEKKKI